MRKLVTAFACCALATGLLVAPASAESSMNMGIGLTLNGVSVSDSAAHIMPNSRAFISVSLFANYYGVTYNFDAATGTLTLDGKTVSNQYGTAHVHDGVLTASARALMDSLGEDHAEIGWDSNTLNVTILPKGVVPLDGHFVVPKMGEHWANPANLPMGPIYGVYKGKLVFLEYMPDKDLDKTVHDIPGTTVPIPGKIDHVDIDWNPNGHPGDLNPHYDVHMYFITRAEQDQIQ